MLNVYVEVNGSISNIPYRIPIAVLRVLMYYLYSNHLMILSVIHDQQGKKNIK